MNKFRDGGGGEFFQNWEVKIDSLAIKKTTEITVLERSEYFDFYCTVFKDEKFNSKSFKMFNVHETYLGPEEDHLSQGYTWFKTLNPEKALESMQRNGHNKTKLNIHVRE